MAENSALDKTEEATPKRLQKAREKGNVPKSPELNSVFILFFGLLTLYFLSTGILNRLISIFKSFYQQAGSMTITNSSIQYLFSAGLGAMISMIAPLMIVLTIIGLSVNVVQFGFLFTLKPLAPQLSRLNPLTGFKKFFSLKSLMELAKSFLKIFLVGLITYWTIHRNIESYIQLIHESVGQILVFIATSVFRIAMSIAGALMVLAVVDFLYQKWQFKKDLRMTKEEVKDEQKDVEGDPLVKNAIRSLQRERARQRMMDDVPRADVVVTNPTNLAIAMKYNPETMSAPVVLAKGARLIAEKIKKIAKQHAIPIIENKPLAQSLYKSCEIGKQIPFELFQTVAEVFAYVYQRKQNRRP